ncbi:MAG: shikimate kinase [Stomatobaculum sp.]|nr:shikimate kinase [Stomatobaculum sp.]
MSKTRPGKRPRGPGKGCITLIGMPACGKSTVGVVLAKKLGKQFIDTDLVIQQQTGKLLKELIEEHGDEGFRAIEDRINASIEAENAVIAPGGSVVYGERAMANFRELGTVVYLKLPYRSVLFRIGDLKERGVSIRPGQTFFQLYQERTRLYEKYADLVVDEQRLPIRSVVKKIILMLEEKESEANG